MDTFHAVFFAPDGKELRTFHLPSYLDFIHWDVRPYANGPANQVVCCFAHGRDISITSLCRGNYREISPFARLKRDHGIDKVELSFYAASRQGSAKLP